MNSHRIGVLAAVAMLAVSITAFEGVARSAISARGTPSSRFGLELNGVGAGYVKTAAGGEPIAQVVEERVGPDKIVKKHIGNVKYEDVTVTVGAGMSPAFYDWIQGTLAHKTQRVNGALTELDFDFKEQARLSMQNALLAGIEFPSLDASAREPAYFTVTFQPEVTRYLRGNGAQNVSTKNSSATAANRGLMRSNFRLKIDGIDCTHVSKVDAFTVKQKSTESAIGELRDYEQVPTNLELGNLVVTVDEAHAQDFTTWRNDFIISGRSADANEKNGTLEYLAPDMKTALFTISFKHLGIFKMGGDQVSASDAVRKVKVSMYVEDASFTYDRAVLP